ncbi:bacterial proteasome activator family protein [Actinotalea solisilvae]|uniref:bacterial proteasome activator family protein n=1 Tax=Actinotalea solisilvae TaxID=2072922 RepID=UPI0018F1B57D|nr:bacterial proteasome activator family protein [Actinotalea solisilvae]
MDPAPTQPTPDADAAPTPDGAPEATPDATFIGQPAKVMRIGTMVKQLLEEVRTSPLDEAARGRLAEVHERSLRELEDGLSPDLVDELRRISLPFSDDNPTEGELRVAQAQLVGWLEGLFHGLQTALVAQQMATQAQLTQMRRALPPGSGQGPAGAPGSAPTVIPGAAGTGGDETRQGTGQYL